MRTLTGTTIISLFLLVTSCSGPATTTYVTPQGWCRTGETQAYQTGIDPNDEGSKGVATILALEAADTSGCEGLTQSFMAAPFAGQRIRLKAMLKTTSLDCMAALRMQIDCPQSQVQATTEAPVKTVQLMSMAQASGNEWKEYEVVMEVPARASTIGIALFLSGHGQVWMKDVSVEKANDAAIPTSLSYQGIANCDTDDEKTDTVDIRNTNSFELRDRYIGRRGACMPPFTPGCPVLPAPENLALAK